MLNYLMFLPCLAALIGVVYWLSPERKLERKLAALYKESYYAREREREAAEARPPEPGEYVLAYATRPGWRQASWFIATRGESLLQPEKGIFWFTDAGLELDVHAWRPLPAPPSL